MVSKLNIRRDGTDGVSASNGCAHAHCSLAGRATCNLSDTEGKKTIEVDTIWRRAQFNMFFLSYHFAFLFLQQFLLLAILHAIQLMLKLC